MQVTLAELARIIGGCLCGEEDTLITGVAPIEEAVKGDITFITGRRYQRLLKSTKASAVILPKGMEEIAPVPAITVQNPQFAFLKAFKHFYPQRCDFAAGIHPTALIGENTELGEGVSIGPNVVIGERVKVGPEVVICANVVIGDDCQIGGSTFIYPNVTIREETHIGTNVIIHPGAVIGSDGFGFVQEKGRYYKIPQIGRVVIEDDVEIGANTTIDRGTMGVTRIGRGTKIDNLVQIAHNVTVGEDTVIAGQAGISGSTHIGKGVKIGGQAGFVDHIQVGDGASIGAQAGVTKSIPPGLAVSGYPARSHILAKRIEASESRLPEILKLLREQDKRIAELEKKLS
ncbi:MAG TPA: UDP-3-O-(3-hydroxymyristoyl)glucosamine N-acyltransferase [Candidatus Latescibacteria bacterium]|nr:UDP-3-O-(3-hydroxymyristoyl)glucosamine N-acyltransferase [Candidatus Latescibacterota bacterium]